MTINNKFIDAHVQLKYNHLKRITVILLGGLLLTALAACGLNKNSREWIEKNRVDDMYKVYPTENPVDLFKVFPEGFEIIQYYSVKNGPYYHIELTGNADTKEITGVFEKNDGQSNKFVKLSDVSIVNHQLQFSNNITRSEWPLKGLLLQQLDLNQNYLNELEVDKYYFNSNSGYFQISYKLGSDRLTQSLLTGEAKIKILEISGFGKNYFHRTLELRLEDDSAIGESIKRLNSD